MAKLGTLTDNFPGSTLDPTKWATLNGAPTWLSDNQAELPCIASDPEFRTVTTWDLQSSQLSAKITPPVLSPGAAVAMVCEQNTNNHVSFLMQVLAGGSAILVPRMLVGGVNNDDQLVYDPTQHAYWRIREQNSYVAWETSPNGQFWELQRYEPVGSLDLSLVTVRFLCGIV